MTADERALCASRRPEEWLILADFLLDEGRQEQSEQVRLRAQWWLALVPAMARLTVHRRYFEQFVDAPTTLRVTVEKTPNQISLRLAQKRMVFIPQHLYDLLPALNYTTKGMEWDALTKAQWRYLNSRMTAVKTLEEMP